MKIAVVSALRVTVGRVQCFLFSLLPMMVAIVELLNGRRLSLVLVCLFVHNTSCSRLLLLLVRQTMRFFVIVGFIANCLSKRRLVARTKN